MNMHSQSRKYHFGAHINGQYRIALSDDDIDSNDSSVEDRAQVKHEESISVAASRHGHAANMTVAEAEALSKKLIEDAMKH